MPVAFADYSGAHIDISTKENITEDFFNISLNTGGKFNTLGKGRFQMDRDGSLFKTPTLDQAALNLGLQEFDEYVKTKNIFNTSFAVERKNSLPELGGNLGFGKNLGIGNQTLSLLASVSASNGYQNMNDAFYKTLEATGNVQDDFAYDSYAQRTETRRTGLPRIYPAPQRPHRLHLLLRPQRHRHLPAPRRCRCRRSRTHRQQQHHAHIYTLQNHQLNGVHNFGTDDTWQLAWGGSYSKTGSEEPDRRQVMYLKADDGSLSLFKLNRQETMRYFGELNEEEWNASLALKWKWNDHNFTSKRGFNYKDKKPRLYAVPASITTSTS